MEMVYGFGAPTPVPSNWVLTSFTSNYRALDSNFRHRSIFSLSRQSSTCRLSHQWRARKGHPANKGEPFWNWAKAFQEIPVSVPKLDPYLCSRRYAPDLIVLLYRFIEALKDPKTWLFFLHAWSQEMANGITNQYSLIINSFGFTILQTTLLGCVTGIVSFFSLISAAVALYYTKVCPRSTTT